MRLTASTVRSLKLPRGRHDHVFFDEDLPGFGLRLRAGGSKTWFLQYAIGGRTRRMTLGSATMLDPGKARETAKDLLAQVRLGRDPAHEKQLGRAHTANTVGALLPRFFERQRARLTRRSFEETNRHLTLHARPLHATPVTALDRRIIADRLSEIASSSGPSAANRVRASLSAFCTWAAREGYLEANPTLYTNKAIEGGPRRRLLGDEELLAIWSALDDGWYGTILKLLILTVARRDEIASLRWSEVDLEAGIITLPATRTKNRRGHIIPLSPAAVTLLAAQPRRLGGDGSPRDLVFGRGKYGFQDWSGSKRELDAKIAAMHGHLPHWTLHDFRRLASTALHERLGTSPHIVESVLSHVSGHQGGVSGVYNMSSYLEERRRALERWANLVVSIVTGQSVKADVVTIRRKVKRAAR